MTFDPLSVLTRPRKLSQVIFCAALLVYAFAAVFFFVGWLNPSLDGRSTQHIAADSNNYITIARAIREGNVDPLTIAALASFPNGLWSPVLLALLIPSTIAMAIFNCMMFAASVYMLCEVTGASPIIFSSLMLMNMTTFVSLLSVNKELPDLFLVALFLYAKEQRRPILLTAALLMALVNRVEVFAVMLLYLFAQSRLNPLRQRRGLTIGVLLFGLSIALPTLGSGELTHRFEEASSGGIVTFLDQMEMHFLYVFAFVPKLLESLFAELLSFSKWSTYSMNDAANTYIEWANNFSNLIVVGLLLYRRTFTLRNDTMYFAVLGAVIMAVSLVIQPRYFFFVYALMCLDLARDLPVQRYRLKLWPAVQRGVIHG